MNFLSSLRSRGARRQAFTLIELLVVIAIIALLAAILFPVFGRARENARRSSCQSNLKNLGLGIHQYLQDYDERYPTQWKPNDVSYLTPVTLYGPAWGAQIYPYVKSVGVYVCPSDPKKLDAGKKPLSYIANTNVFVTYFNSVSGLAANGVTAGNSALFRGPAMTILLFEGKNEYAGANTAGVPNQKGANPEIEGDPWSPTSNGRSQFVEYPRSWAYSATDVLGTALGAGRTSGNGGITAQHFDGGNYLMADGHVKWFLPDTVSPGNNAATSTAVQGGNAGNNVDLSPYGAAGTACPGVAATFSIY